MLVLLAHGLEELAEPLLVTVARHRHLRVAGHGALEHAEHVDVAAERVGERLEDERDGGLGGIAGELGAVALGGEDGPRHVGGRRGQREHVEQQVDTDAQGGRAAGHREDLAGGNGRREGGVEFGGGDLFFHEVLLGELVVGARDGVDELVAGLGGLVGQVGGDVAHLGLAAVVDDALHGEQVDDALERRVRRRWAAGPARPGGRKPPAGSTSGMAEVGALTVEHVAEEHATQAALVGTAPETLGLYLDAEDGVDHDERRLDDVQGGDGVGEEAGVAGCVDEVEGDTVALDVRQTRRQAHLALLLVVVPVRHGACRR